MSSNDENNSSEEEKYLTESMEKNTEGGEEKKQSEEEKNKSEVPVTEEESKIEDSSDPKSSQRATTRDSGLTSQASVTYRDADEYRREVSELLSPITDTPESSAFEEPPTSTDIVFDDESIIWGPPPPYSSNEVSESPPTPESSASEEVSESPPSISDTPESSASEELPTSADIVFDEESIIWGPPPPYSSIEVSESPPSISDTPESSASEVRSEELPTSADIVFDEESIIWGPPPPYSSIGLCNGHVVFNSDSFGSSSWSSTEIEELNISIAEEVSLDGVPHGDINEVFDANEIIPNNFEDASVEFEMQDEHNSEAVDEGMPPEDHVGVTIQIITSEELDNDQDIQLDKSQLPEDKPSSHILDPEKTEYVLACLWSYAIFVHSSEQRYKEERNSGQNISSDVSPTTYESTTVSEAASDIASGQTELESQSAAHPNENLENSPNNDDVKKEKNEHNPETEEESMPLKDHTGVNNQTVTCEELDKAQDIQLDKAFLKRQLPEDKSSSHILDPETTEYVLACLWSYAIFVHSSEQRYKEERNSGQNISLDVSPTTYESTTVSETASDIPSGQTEIESPRAAHQDNVPNEDFDNSPNNDDVKKEKDKNEPDDLQDPDIEE